MVNICRAYKPHIMGITTKALTLEQWITDLRQLIKYKYVKWKELKTLNKQHCIRKYKCRKMRKASKTKQLEKIQGQ